MTTTMRASHWRLLPLIAFAIAPLANAQDPALVLDAQLHHLGDTHVESWEGVPPDPEGTRLELKFRSRANESEHVLSLRHQHVDERWSVQLNGKEVGALERGNVLRLANFVVPPETLVDGDNQLSITTQKTTDDIIVGDVRLDPRSLREVLALQPVRIRVQDGKGGGLPARVTITDPAGALVDLYYGERLHAAVRKGISYTADGEVMFELPPGDYVVHATRGSEWGLDTAEVHVDSAAPGDAAVGPIDLAIEREVDTTGYVASDTHVHTLTFSGHGDASVEERLVTLAAEGVELAIATDHNHHTDYRPLQEEMELNEHFKAVTGNEVTTRVGHVNAFPMDPDGRIPDHELRDWILLVDDIRAQGAKVVILNHPRWPQIPTGPFGVFHLDRMSGDLPGQKAVPFDAMELVNALTLQTDPMYLFVDWFALLNHGERVKAVGASDSHSVGEPVGQGRTYVRSSTDVPSEIDVDEACNAFIEGRSTISLGIFCDLVVDERHTMGDLVPAADREVALSLRVAAPSWITPRTARVFVNGTQVAEQDVPVTEGQPTDTWLPFTISTPAHDAHLVCVVLGDGVKAAYWRTDKPYTLAATNPVWLDFDADGSYTSPRAQAMALVKKYGTEPAELRPALDKVDDAVAIETLSLVLAEYEKGSFNLANLERARARLAELVAGTGRDILSRYVESLPPPAKIIEDAAKRSASQAQQPEKSKL